MKTILFISKAPPYSGGGAENVIWELGQHLAQNGWDVHYLCPDGDAPSRENIHHWPISTPNTFFAEKVGFFVKSPIKFINILKKIDPDIVYDNSSPIPYIYAYATSKKTVTKVHAVYGMKAFSNKDNIITKIGTIIGEQLYRVLDGDKILAVSKSTRSELQSVVNRSPDKIHLVENGIKTEEYEYNYNPNGDILCLCALTPRKNISTLLKSWKQIQARGNISRKLIIAGDGPCRTELEREAEELDLENISFRGYVEEGEKKELMKNAHIYVLPTKMEGFGLSNLEAMASGCITITSDTLGVRDYMIDGENGHLIESTNHRELAAVMRCCLKNKENQKSIAEAARQTAESYRLEEMVEQEREVLESFI
ncbi:hypothetical protein Z052_18220 [Halorubrum sp. C191]|uniref:glycosyltransferase family 4 protein n=1 Tax=Halorubrum sp. C191 TaxID=1383842 RepID=UPI000C0869F1|nr:glycosyltransferase family 4 protein [Halorubrum sp. C191]PHQ40807.1 hypothetical protein Z052_18220 [Halorubrum sp. C191]